MEKYKIFRLFTVIILIGIFSLYVRNLTGWLINDDEGSYFYEFWRINNGDVPYKDFFVPEAPLSLFTGYIIFKLFGPSVFLARMLTVIVAFLTGYLIFLIGRRVYSYKVGLFGFISYLILPVVYLQARFYRSETYMVFFSTLGLLMFIKAWQDNKRLFFVYSGIFYAVSLWYKLWGALSLIALLAFILYQAFLEKKPLAIIKDILLPFLIGLSGITLFIYLIVHNMVPLFLECVVGLHMRQPTLSSSQRLATIIANIKGFLMVSPIQYGYKDKHSWLIIFSLPLAVLYLFNKRGRDIKKIFSFYIFSVSGVILTNPYGTETTRYMLYLVPVAVLVSISFIFYLIQPNKPFLVKMCGFAIFAFVMVAVFIPGFIRNAALSGIREDGTLAFAKYIRDRTAEEDYIMADYGDVTFYAKRRTTPLMAGMNKAAVDDKGITSGKLIKELGEYPVKMIVIHREGGVPQKLGLYLGTPCLPHHFSTLIESEDGPKFMGYLKKYYRLVDEFDRMGQIFDVYIKR